MNDATFDWLRQLMQPGDDGLDLFAQWLAPPAWHGRAACRGQDPALFFPERGAATTAAAAIAICTGCPVRSECLDAALALGTELPGIWGGTTTNERRELRRERRRDTAA